MSMTRRPRPQVVSLTDEAANRVKAILADSGKAYLRVGVVNGGCAGMEYLMEYADTPEKLDEIVEDKGVKMLIKADAVLFLIGSQIGFEQTRLSQKFTFTNPNQTDACGCGESVTITPAKEEA
jgi:iron-sulfur cluster assembly protein